MIVPTVGGGHGSGVGAELRAAGLACVFSAGLALWCFQLRVAYRIDAGLPSESSAGEDFALPGELLLPVAAKVTKSACPSIRPGAWPRRVPSLHRRSEGPAL